MNPTANVASVPALREWHAAVTTFRTHALEALASIELAINKAGAWLADREQDWKRAAKAADEAVTQAKADLFNKRYPDFAGRMPDTSQELKALKKAQAWLEHCQEKVAACRHWQVKLPRAVSEAYSGRGRQFAAFLEGELPRGLALLARRLAALEAYLATAAPAAKEET